MIKIIYIVLVFGLHLFSLQDEKVIGIFKTGKDYKEGRLSFIIDCKSKKDKILLNDFFDKKYITVKENDSTYKLLKSNIYGYKTCNKNVYRFLNKKELLLLNSGEEILIYIRQLPKPPAGRTNVTNYYFSVGPESEAQELTIRKLKNAFQDNTKFQLLIDSNFKYNMDLAAFDENNKMYKINWLLKNTEK